MKIKVVVFESIKDNTMSENKNLYKITFSNKGDRYYKYEWEVNGVIDFAPHDYLPLVAYKPDGSIFKVKEKPVRFSDYED